MGNESIIKIGNYTKQMSKKPKVPKVKIPMVDLKTFLAESLEIDPYWNDLYNPPPKKKNKYREILDN